MRLILTNEMMVGASQYSNRAAKRITGILHGMIFLLEWCSLSLYMVDGVSAWRQNGASKRTSGVCFEVLKSYSS